MDSQATEYRDHPWDLSGGRDRGLLVMRYALLPFCLGLTELWLHPSHRSLLIDAGLCAMIAVLVTVLAVRPDWQERPAVMGWFFAGLAGLMAALIVRDSLFGICLLSIGSYAFRLPWPRRLLSAGTMGVLSGMSQVAGVPKDTVGGLALSLTVISVNTYVLCGLAWFIRYNTLKSEQREQALAALAAANRKLETALAENAGLHEQLLTQAREAGVLDERQRMAREIHDTLAQGLTGIITQLQAAEHAAADPAEWRRHFASAAGLARESLTEARRSVDALRPEALETARLSGAVIAVAKRWSAIHGIAVQVTTTGAERPVSPAAESTLLRAAQEALANVAKHAKATRVGLTLSYMENEVALDVRDDGAGFDRAAAAPARAGGGFGLIAMKQRIEALAGTLQVESEPGGGTAISACVPAAAGWASA
jgi:signal transduction histidine kinase